MKAQILSEEQYIGKRETKILTPEDLTISIATGNIKHSLTPSQFTVNSHTRYLLISVPVTQYKSVLNRKFTMCDKRQEKT